MPDAGSMKPFDLGVWGLSHIVLETVDPDRSASFYGEMLGLEARPHTSWPGCESSATLAAGQGQSLILALSSNMLDLRETGVHQAFALSQTRRDKAEANLRAKGVEIFSYVEDRPAESSDGFYFFDPDGNRIQLVVSSDLDDEALPVLDHAAVQVAEMLWAERFYAEVLGLAPIHRVGWNTADYARAQAWADGKEDMAPGTRRLDKRYTSMVNNRLMPRVNMQVYFACGNGVLGIYLANQHYQESPEEACLGTPRIALELGVDAFARLQNRLEEANWRFLGPIHHEAGLPVSASIYVRDPGGNFIEFSVPNDDRR